MNRVAAPVRLDFAGGWTDVPPFVSREGGVVVNATIDRWVEAGFEPGCDGILVVAEDLQQSIRARGPAALARAGPLELHRAALRMFPPGAGTLRTRSAVPPGSGLGSSGALDVALVAVLAAARQEPLTPEDLAHHGWQLETVEARFPGGRQDQYAAALGGFHRLALTDAATLPQPLPLDPAFLAELGRRTLVCYTGRSRVSGDTVARVMAAYERQDQVVTGALRELVEVAERMTEALLAADLATVGRLLSKNWDCQQRLDGGMRTPEMAALEAAVVEARPLGGKAAGAGAGRCMLFLIGGDLETARQAAARVGTRVLGANFVSRGVHPC